MENSLFFDLLHLLTLKQELDTLMIPEFLSLFVSLLSFVLSSLLHVFSFNPTWVLRCYVKFFIIQFYQKFLSLFQGPSCILIFSLLSKITNKLLTEIKNTQYFQQNNEACNKVLMENLFLLSLLWVNFSLFLLVLNSE